MIYKAVFRGGPLDGPEHDRMFMSGQVLPKLVFAQFPGVVDRVPGGWALYETRPELITQAAWDDLGPDRRATYVLGEEGTVLAEHPGDEGLLVYHFEPEAAAA